MQPSARPVVLAPAAATPPPPLPPSAVPPPGPASVLDPHHPANVTTSTSFPAATETAPTPVALVPPAPNQPQQPPPPTTVVAHAPGAPGPAPTSTVAAATASTPALALSDGEGADEAVVKVDDTRFFEETRKYHTIWASGRMTWEPWESFYDAQGGVVTEAAQDFIKRNPKYEQYYLASLGITSTSRP